MDCAIVSHSSESTVECSLCPSFGVVTIEFMNLLMALHRLAAAIRASCIGKQPQKPRGMIEYLHGLRDRVTFIGIHGRMQFMSLIRGCYNRIYEFTYGLTPSGCGY